MTTLQNLVDRTSHYLYAGFREERDTLAASYTAGGTTLTFTNMTAGIQAGASLAIDSEIFYVVSPNVSAKTATVSPGDQGSTSANHNNNAIVVVNPRFSQFDVINAINDELLDLSSPANGLFQVKTLDITYNAAIEGYDLTGISASFIDIQEARWKPPGPSLRYPLIKRYAVARSMPTGDFASGSALIVQDEQPPLPGRSIRVRYRAPFASLTNLTDDVVTVSGLHTEAHDIPPMGAAIRLVAGREIKRNFNEDEGEPRRADEIPQGATMKSTMALQSLHDRRVKAEAARLKRWWPDQTHL